MKKTDYKELKKGGMMRQCEKGRFSVRLHITGGRIRSKGLKAIKDVADKYGSGQVHLTARQGVEIPDISQENLWVVKSELASGGIGVGVCGPTIRTVTACQGCRIGPNGVVDSPGLAEMIDEHFYGKTVPHKFKIGISKCANNCLKAEEATLKDKDLKSVMILVKSEGYKVIDVFREGQFCHLLVESPILHPGNIS
ncbi:MAG: hypothetical protein EHM36_00515 [Deltaproteobacteria bacterium]|nr:MAG: hypothetical protein EHM36_00515 [Deltaproteobacteria bacterium]